MIHEVAKEAVRSGDSTSCSYFVFSFFSLLLVDVVAVVGGRGRGCVGMALEAGEHSSCAFVSLGVGEMDEGDVYCMRGVGWVILTLIDLSVEMT